MVNHLLIADIAYAKYPSQVVWLSAQSKTGHDNSDLKIYVWFKKVRFSHKKKDGEGMKIPLNMGNNGGQSTKAAQIKTLERDILASKKGDWNAKNNLVRTFMPLLNSLAEKRTSDTGQKNKLIEAGKEGLFNAAGRYKENMGADKFQVFALDFIESSMDSSGKSGGFFARLFGRG